MDFPGMDDPLVDPSIAPALVFPDALLGEFRAFAVTV
jgi:hypothetical protein